MNIVCRYSSWVPKKLGADAITLYPFVFFSMTKAAALKTMILHHEMVHVRQVRALGWLKFYWKYIWQYFAGRLKGLDEDLAYRTITFEREAYDAQATVVFTEAEKKELSL